MYVINWDNVMCFLQLVYLNGDLWTPKSKSKQMQFTKKVPPLLKCKKYILNNVLMTISSPPPPTSFIKYCKWTPKWKQDLCNVTETLVSVVCSSLFHKVRLKGVPIDSNVGDLWFQRQYQQTTLGAPLDIDTVISFKHQMKLVGSLLCEDLDKVQAGLKIPVGGDKRCQVTCGHYTCLIFHQTWLVVSRYFKQKCIVTVLWLLAVSEFLLMLVSNSFSVGNAIQQVCNISQHSVWLKWGEIKNQKCMARTNFSHRPQLSL